MIRKEDLMIGDKLYYQTEEGLMVTTLDWQDLKWVSEDEKGFNLAHKPIPLEEDILLKCGNEKELMSDGFYRYNLNGVGIDMPYFEFCHNDNSIEIKYVHQYQQLYKSLTQQDLKVEL